jgi:hypothetical protein
MIYICKICGTVIKLRRNFNTKNNDKMRFPVPHLRNNQTCHGFFEEVISKEKNESNHRR